MSLEPIETLYSGTTYRSRTEARWAVMFDKAGVGFQYEPEGFKFASGNYVPDFYISAWNCYLEIKPNDFDLPAGEWPRERCVAEELAEQSNKDVLIAAGWPCVGMMLFRINPDEMPSVSKVALAEYVSHWPVEEAGKFRFDWLDRNKQNRARDVASLIRRTAWQKRFPS